MQYNFFHFHYELKDKGAQYWYQMRLNYIKLHSIVEELVGICWSIIIISFMNNCYFICIQILSAFTWAFIEILKFICYSKNFTSFFYRTAIFMRFSFLFFWQTRSFLHAKYLFLVLHELFDSANLNGFT